MTDVVAESTSTELTVQARAQIALGTSKREAELIALAAASKDLIEIRDSASCQQIHGARMERKRARLDVEYTAEKAREDARDFAKAVIAEQKRLIAIVEPEETRLEAIETAYNAKLATEREAKRKAEQERIAKIQGAINDLREFAINSAYQTAAQIAELMDLLEQQPVDEKFAEFKSDAEQVKVATMNKLNAMHAAAVDREAAAKAEAERLAAEQERMRLEREELDRKKAEQAERDRIAREDLERRQAEQAAREQAEQERVALERRQREETLRLEALERERIEAEAKAQRDTAEAESKARIEVQERAAAEARQRAEEEAAGRLAAETARMRAESDRLEKERLAKEKREREAEEKRQAKETARIAKEQAAERARMEKAEAEERERQRQAQERMDARELADAFVTRFGQLPEWSRTVAAIGEDLAEIEAAEGRRP